MWIELFLFLLLAHLMADFVFQTSASCKSKAEKHWVSVHQYIHALIVFVLAWLVSWDASFWWAALIIGLAHLGLDIWKSYCPETVVWFSVDQLLHISVIAFAAWAWSCRSSWGIPLGIDVAIVAYADAFLMCWKPANFFIKLMLKHYSVNMPADNASGFNAGALIGTVERWLILIFVCMQRYEALGLLIAAKSIIRYSEKDTERTEYVLAGTLLSIFISVIMGLIVMIYTKEIHV